MSNLEAIEADDYKSLPGGIFNKSFVKNYARCVGFPEGRALELYERTSRERGFQSEEPATSPQRSRVYTGESARSPLMTYGLSVIIVGLLALVVYAGLHYYRRGEAEQGGGTAATPTPAAAQQQPAAAQPTPTPAAEGFKVQVKSTRMFWLTSWQEGEKKRGRMLKPDAPEEFEPTAPFNLHYDRGSAEALQVSVNGRLLKAPADATTWTITRDNYTQFAQ